MYFNYLEKADPDITAAMKRDQFVDEALKSAHLQIIHTYGTQNLKDKIIEALNK